MTEVVELKYQRFTLLGMVADCALMGLYLSVFMRLRHIHELNAYMGGPNVLARYVLVILVCVAVLYSFGLYDSRLISRGREHARREILVRLLQAFGAALLA